MKAEGDRFLEELKALTNEEIELKNVIEEQEREARRLDREREIYYKEYNKHQKNYLQACDEAKRYLFREIGFVFHKVFQPGVSNQLLTNAAGQIKKNKCV